MVSSIEVLKPKLCINFSFSSTHLIILYLITINYSYFFWHILTCQVFYDEQLVPFTVPKLDGHPLSVPTTSYTLYSLLPTLSEGHLLHVQYEVVPCCGDDWPTYCGSYFHILILLVAVFSQPVSRTLILLLICYSNKNNFRSYSIF